MFFIQWNIPLSCNVILTANFATDKINKILEDKRLRQSMKQTPLYEIHVALKGKIVDFAGWELPVQYSGVINETKAVRTSMGLFDVSHMGRFWIDGPQANDFLNWIHSNDVANMKYGKAKYGLICNEQGGIIDDAIVYRLSETRHLLVANAANANAIHQWLLSWQEKRYKNVSITPAEELPGMIAFQGPDALNTLSKLLTSSQIAEMRPFSLVIENFQGQDLYVARTGYTGEDGVELMLGTSAAVSLWTNLIDLGVTPCGLGSRDTLRLEAALPLHGNEITIETTPVEAGLARFLSYNSEFCGSKYIQNISETGPVTRLIGFATASRGPIPRHDAPIKSAGEIIGTVTSGSYSPTLDRNIGLGYVSATADLSKNNLVVAVRDKEVEIEQVNLPFYSRKER